MIPSPAAEAEGALQRSGDGTLKASVELPVILPLCRAAVASEAP
jgi:hypothetical protein